MGVKWLIDKYNHKPQSKKTQPNPTQPNQKRKTIMGKSQMFKEFKNALNDMNVRYKFENDRFDIEGVIVEFRKDEYGGYLLTTDPKNVFMGDFDMSYNRETVDTNVLAKKFADHQSFNDLWK